MPIQQMLLGAGSAVATKTYVDDIFSTFLYKGTGSSQAINNGIDLSSEGGMTWVKERNNSSYHFLTDTVRGFKTTDNSGNPMSPEGYSIFSNDGAAQSNYNGITAFNSNGFSLGTDSDFNANGDQYASWTFRKAPGFFDVVTWSGDGNAGRQISHSLGCVPGAIFTKRLNVSENWLCYHKGMGNEKYIHLNLNNAMGDATYFNDTDPTSTYFTVNGAQQINGAGYTYVAYVFAGGKASETNSVYFDGTGDYLSLAASSDLTFDGDFTIEWWSYRGSSGGMSAFGIGNLQTLGGMEVFFHSADGKVHIYTTDSSGGSNRLISTDTFAVSKWQHYALVRSGSTITLYFDGKSQGSWTESQTLGPSGNNTFTIGCSTGNSGVGALWTGKISNFRITKGQAVYKTTFNVPHDPLTQTSQNENSSNVKLLCCNGSTTTASTVTPGTITANGDPTIQGSQSIFDDTSANVFGENKDQGIIKCGSYVGNGSSTGPEINLGWEPQYILLKNADEGEQWQIFDSMRGIVTDGDDTKLLASNDGSESSNNDILDLTPTGFKLKTSATDYNGNNDRIIYIAIRRPDGYVGKPPELGTDVFAMDTGNASSTIPAFDSTFPVDFALAKLTGDNGSWDAVARLMQHWYLIPNDDDEALEDNSNYNFDSNAGWSVGYPSTYQSYMWKRHKGMDVITFKGNGSARQIPHSLNQIPEMILTKNRTTDYEWNHYHKGLNGGTNPEQYYLQFTTAAEVQNSGRWNDQAPTATHFSIGNHASVNANNASIIAMLFASVDGISKVGSYTGDDSNDGSHEINVGFTPRFLIIKRADGSADWKVFDTTNGFPTSGAANFLELNTIDGKYTGSSTTVTQSTNGFKLWSPGSPYNANTAEYIYYAHA